MTEIKLGDTVRVEYEGCVTGLHTADHDVLQVTTPTGRVLYAARSAANKVAPPIPNADGSVITVLGEVYQLDGGLWLVVGSEAVISEGLMQARATSSGFTLLSDGFPE